MILKSKSVKDWHLYLILDLSFIGKRDYLEVARAAIAGGVEVIQLRGKKAAVRELIAAGQKLRTLTRKQSAIFIVNDRVDVALACGADGIHLGQDDLPLKFARKIVGGDKIIGISCHSLKEARRAQAEGADYLAVGPVFVTSTKPGVAAVGLRLVRDAKRHIRIPWLAIGGINPANVDEILRAGGERVAVARAVLGARDVKRAARRLHDKIESFFKAGQSV